MAESDQERRMDAWMSLVRTQSHLLDLLEADLRRRAGITLPRFDVLAQLDRRGGRLRFQRLADAILLSRSGMSRLLDRMERDGLIAREGAPEDARGQVVVIRPAGLKLLSKARAVHDADVQRWFVDQVGTDEADVITRVLHRVRLGVPGGAEAEAAIAWGPPGAVRDRPAAVDETGPGANRPGGSPGVDS